MAFDESLKRLREAAQDHPVDGRHRHHSHPDARVVRRRDLDELLRHFDRADAESRMTYPPHRAQLAQALARLTPVMEELEQALHRMGPPR